jgi:hypothetical protein
MRRFRHDLDTCESVAAIHANVVGEVCDNSVGIEVLRTAAEKDLGPVVELARPEAVVVGHGEEEK